MKKKAMVSFCNEYDKVLEKVDFDLLQESYKTEEKEYAKGVLNELHEAMVDIYGHNTLDFPRFDFVHVPGVIHCKKTKETCITLLTLDLSSSGEHWETYFLNRNGVEQQGQGDTLERYIPYQYMYTADIPCDIHVKYNKLSGAITEILESFHGCVFQGGDEN